ncbi:hypothetical protein PHMEG_0005408 [Phytophthora megakarya]|uniref:DUF676 domain-containing protein n=1 Tax=Phytophthora megakarya TaxID=4795 RepID=A0A225WSZ7_9STRA|nr:hypothetical protein PHMEG_0005408 [Phytophthora megakarya]
MRSPRRNSTDNTQLQRATHLVILQHGLLGSQHDFARFVKIFRSQFHPDELYLYTSESNAASFFQTYDGVDLGGKRLADEIEQLAAKMPKLQKLSTIGHSLGGLYNRYCIGLLLNRGFFDKVAPMNFVTLATPHLGIRRPRRGPTNVVFNALMPKIFSRTGAQLTLIDASSDETLALSKSSISNLNKNFHPALSAVDGSLLISLPASEKRQNDSQKPFELYECELVHRKLRVFENNEKKPKNNLKFEVDLTCANVKILLPSGKSMGDGANFYSSFIGWDQIDENEKIDKSGNLDIHILWTTETPDMSEPGDEKLCVLRIPQEDVHRDWRWLVALSNASFGVTCLTSDETTKKTKKLETSALPLLSCLTRGQFMQALQMFKVRTLYSSIFFDMQVPYTCAAVRAYNPYRLTAKEFAMSPIYTHIVQDSLKNARKLRDTIPLKVKRLAMKYMAPIHAALDSPSSPKEHGTRPEPYIDGDIILDQLPYAFTADAEQDELRGMLLSVQSVGWRRIDVLFGGVMSHEHIIAKRANLDKPLESGIDVVHHVMDTFLL